MPYKHKFAGVYKIENIRNGKIYIGSTGHFYHRKAQHLHELRNGKHWILDLQKDFNVFGECFFKFVLIKEMPNATQEELMSKEQKYVDSLCPEYNQSPITTYGKFEYTDEIKEKISVAVTSLWKDPAYRENFSAKNKGRVSNRKGVTLSEETKEKLRQANLGANSPRYGKPRSQGFMDKVRKTYPGVVSPDGEIFTNIVGLNEFCRQHGLDSGGSPE